MKDLSLFNKVRKKMLENLFLAPIWACEMLDIVPCCNPVQYQGNLIMQTWENDKNLGPPIFFHEFYLY